MVTRGVARAQPWRALGVGLGLALVVGEAGQAGAQAPELPAAPDTSETETLAREDAWSVSGGEPGLVIDEAPREESIRGRLVVAQGGYAWWARAPLQGRRAVLEGLLAREPHEARTVDDALARLTLRPVRDWTVSLGRVEPTAGAGLVLGAAWLRPRDPTALTRGALVSERALVPATPARAQGTSRGAWITGGRGRTKIGVLLARNARDALPRGDLLVPRPGARHIDAASDSARGRLRESVLGLAANHGGAWVSAVLRRGAPFAFATTGASASAIRSAPRVGSGLWMEGGVRGEGAQLALARDPHGRMALALWAGQRAKVERSSAGLEIDVRDPRFAPPLGRVDVRPYAHASALLARPAGRGGWRVEAHVLERRPFDPVLAWCTARLATARGGWLDVRRDASPPRSVVGAGTAGAGLAWRVELRFDRHGLARERWAVRGQRALGRRLALVGEAALGGGRAPGGFAEADVPGGGWVALGSGDARTRATLAWRGRLAPSLAWLCRDDGRATRSEVRFVAGFGPGEGP